MTNIDLRHGSYADVLQDQTETLDLIFTSPPYNIGSKSPRIDGQRKKRQVRPEELRLYHGLRRQPA